MKYRAIHGSFWTDPKVKRLSPDQKLLFLYLITCPHSHLSGIYYLPCGLISHETGLCADIARAGLLRLQEAGLVRWDETAEVVWVVNMLRYQGSGAKNFKAVADQLAALHDSPLVKAFAEHYPQIPYRYPIDGVFLQEQEQEQNQEQEAIHLPLSSKTAEGEDVPYGEIIDRLNERTRSNYQASGKDTRKHIRARWSEGYRLEDFFKVIDVKVAEWRSTEFAKYLRPATLFGPKFESYLNSPVASAEPVGEAYQPFKEEDDVYQVSSPERSAGS